MDWGSLAGLALALAGIVAGQLLEGGHAGSLLQPAAFLIVAVGTLGAVLLQSGWPVFLRAMRMTRHVFVSAPDEHARLASAVMLWCASARREGLLSLERFCERETDLFVRKGLHLIADGADAERLRMVLEQDITIYERRERAAVRVWESAGGYAPTVGILGAVLGLIQVMENLGDPARLGAGIAVAFVATVYGVGLANLVFLPVAGKLKSLLQTEVGRRELMVDVLCGITSGENSMLIADRLAGWTA
ncbi:MAG: flagellar motor protein [Massilia sp.]|nr:flagellar motor protein [Massilia sp.]